MLYIVKLNVIQTSKVDDAEKTWTSGTFELGAPFDKLWYLDHVKYYKDLKKQDTSMFCM